MNFLALESIKSIFHLFKKSLSFMIYSHVIVVSVDGHWLVNPGGVVDGLSIEVNVTLSGPNAITKTGPVTFWPFVVTTKMYLFIDCKLIGIENWELLASSSFPVIKFSSLFNGLNLSAYKYPYVSTPATL
jgi:hypothetical protein